MYVIHVCVYILYIYIRMYMHIPMYVHTCTMTLSSPLSEQIMHDQIILGENNESQRLLGLHGKRSGRHAQKVDNGGSGREKGERFAMADGECLWTRVTVFWITSTAYVPCVTG